MGPHAVGAIGRVDSGLTMIVLGSSSLRSRWLVAVGRADRRLLDASCPCSACAHLAGQSGRTTDTLIKSEIGCRDETGCDVGMAFRAEQASTCQSDH